MRFKATRFSVMRFKAIRFKAMRRPDLEALATAKARQDASHRKLDKFITAALAELSDRRRMG